MQIAIGISGGVDSAVAALLLKRDGHAVHGVIMKIWDDSISNGNDVPLGNACFGPEEKFDIEDARRICDTVGIELTVIDCAQEFQASILSYFRTSYLSGQTPNPCVYCNQKLKFGLLPTLLAEKTGTHFDAYATGHYARVHSPKPDRVVLRRAIDLPKDQTYFLHRLSTVQLAKALFPLGGLRKQEVRDIAREAKLHVWDKRESQDFYAGDYRTLINPASAAQSEQSTDGTIVDTNGTILGNHHGIWNYTIGQRKGLGICSTRPLYVTAINAATNQVVVGDESALMHCGVRAIDFNTLYDQSSESYTCKIRSSQQEVPCSLQWISSSTVDITFAEPTRGICPGQAVVVYSGDIVIGGGTIEAPL